MKKIGNMKNKQTINIVLFIIAFISFTAQSIIAQVEFKASVSKSKLAEGDRFQIEFKVNKNGADNFVPPPFTHFRVIGGPSQSVNQSWINGKSSFSKGYTYIVEPKKKGTYTIGSAYIEVNGETYKTKPVEITVLDSKDLPKNPNDPNYLARENIHIVAHISNKNPYLGQVIDVEYRLYVSNEINVNDWRYKNAPQYNGFWHEDKEIKNNVAKETKFKGEDYRYVVLKRDILIPQKSGKLTIDPLEMDISVAIPTNRGDFFGNMIFNNYTYGFNSKSVAVDVKDLPIQGKPKDFKGAVGDFSFEVTTNKTELNRNESAQIKVEVSGTGNLKLFSLPELSFPSDLEVYEPEYKDKVNTTLKGIKGEVSKVYTVVPQYKGKYIIPSTRFTYFNPKNKQYYTIESGESILESKQEAVSSVDNEEIDKNEDALSVDKKEVKQKAKYFKYIQTNSLFTSINADDFYKSKLFYTLLLLPILAIPLGIVLGNSYRTKRADVLGNRLRKAERMSKKYLSKAAKELGNKETFYLALEKALHNFLKAKLEIKTSELSKKKIIDLLKDKNVDETLIISFIKVLEDCDFARYTPVTDVTIKQEYDKAKKIIIELDKVL